MLLVFVVAKDRIMEFFEINFSATNDQVAIRPEKYWSFSQVPGGGNF